MATPRIAVRSPLGADVFELAKLSGSESLSQLFSYRLELLTKRMDLKLSDLLGQEMSLGLDLPNEQTRHFHGFVSELSCVAGSDGYQHYTVTLRPWLWFLTRTANCRIFQEKSVPDILKSLFQERGFTDFDDTLTGSYRTWEYVVQYRESDFAFVSRLMEQEGIYYYFVHRDGKHVLVLSDGYGSHQPQPGYGAVPYYPPQEGAQRERDHIAHWSFEHNVQPGSYVLEDYNFEQPRAELQAAAVAPKAHAHGEFEIFDYPGEYQLLGDGESYARIRLESLHAEHELARASGDARGLCAGALFELREHPRADQNREYLIVSTDLELIAPTLGSSAEEAAFFRCEMTAMPSAVPYRPHCATPKPTIVGPHTAKVVGKSGEEIWTDQYGRVKVQFPWDREGSSNETSSCWIRVSQVMAGRGWGAMHVPRIGQEVVVEFLEGDPDRPIITGRVYNASNPAPFGLPARAMVSGIKTDSTKGGGGYNEITLDDTKGSEKVVVHGQFDMATTIEHDETLTVHNNRTSTIDVDDTESVGKDQSMDVGHDQTLSVGANQVCTVATDQDLTVDGSQTVQVASNCAHTIGVAKELSVGDKYVARIGAAMNEAVVGLKAVQVGEAQKVVVAANSREKVGGSRSLSAQDDVKETAGKEVTVKAAKRMSIAAQDDLSVGGKKKGAIDIADELDIIVGEARIMLKKDGSVVVKGKKIQLKGSGKLTLKGAKIAHN